MGTSNLTETRFNDNGQEYVIRHQEGVKVKAKTDTPDQTIPGELSGENSKSTTGNNNVPVRKTTLESWSDFITKIEDTIFPEDKNKAGKMEKYGNIGWDEKILHTLKGVGRIFTSMLKNPIPTAIGIAGFAALMTIAGPLAPLLVVLGFSIGTIKVVAGLIKGENAKTDEEARKAYQSFGAGLFTALTSMCGARGAVKTAKANGVGTSIDPDKTTNPFRNLVECFHLTFGGNKGGTSNIYGALSHSWNTKLNQFRNTTKDSAYTTKLKGDITDKTTAKATADGNLKTAEADLQAAQARLNTAVADRNTATSNIENGPELRKQIQANIEESYRQLKLQRDTISDHYGINTPESRGAIRIANEKTVEINRSIGDLNTKLRSMNAGTLNANDARTAGNLAIAEADYAASEAAFNTAGTAFKTAESELTAANEALKAAQQIPSFFGSLLGATWKTTQATGLGM